MLINPDLPLLPQRTFIKFLLRGNNLYKQSLQEASPTGSIWHILSRFGHNLVVIKLSDSHFSPVSWVQFSVTTSPHARTSHFHFNDDSHYRLVPVFYACATITLQQVCYLATSAHEAEFSQDTSQQFIVLLSLMKKMLSKLLYKKLQLRPFKKIIYYI